MADPTDPLAAWRHGLRDYATEFLAWLDGATTPLRHEYSTRTIVGMILGDVIAECRGFEERQDEARSPSRVPSPAEATLVDALARWTASAGTCVAHRAAVAAELGTCAARAHDELARDRALLLHMANRLVGEARALDRQRVWVAELEAAQADLAALPDDPEAP